MLKMIAIGNLTGDPVLKTNEETGKPYAIMRIASDRRYKSPDGEKLTDFISIKVRGILAERCAEFATEDNMGKFEEMDGYGMLRYLTADRFGSVEYEIVAPCYEEAVSLHTDYTSPEYLAFEKKLYEKTLRKLGFGKLLPEERAPQKDMNKRKEKVEER